MSNHENDKSLETFREANMRRFSPLTLPALYLKPELVPDNCRICYREILLPNDSKMSPLQTLVSSTITFFQVAQLEAKESFWMEVQTTDLENEIRSNNTGLSATVPYQFKNSTGTVRNTLEACFEEFQDQQNKYRSLIGASKPDASVDVSSSNSSTTITTLNLNKKYPGTRWEFVLTIPAVGFLGIGSCLEDSKGSLALIPEANCNSKQLMLDILQFIELTVTSPDASVDEISLQIPILRMNRIQNLLQKHPLVEKVSLVLAEERIRAELTLKEDLRIQPSQNDEYVDLWESHFQLSYRDITDPFVGWYSSFTRQPIPVSEMEEWVNGIVLAVEAFKPETVLEIGCGSGLILTKLAPKCRFYHGTDLSAHAVEYLTQSTKGWPGLELSQREAAAEIQAEEKGKYDTVVMNSVTQYFPNVDYLERVILQALEACQPGGRVFIGDVRDLMQFENFHNEVELSQAADSTSMGEFRDNVRSRIAKDIELLLHPKYFEEFAKKHKKIVSHVTIQLHRGKSQTEMIKFRFNVMFHVRMETDFASASPKLYKWNTPICRTKDCIVQILSAFEENVCVVTGIPNTRVALGTLAQKGYLVVNNLQALREIADNLEELAHDPEEFAIVGEALGYKVRLMPSNQDPSTFDILYFKGDDTMNCVMENSEIGPVSALSTNPTLVKERQVALTQIKLHLKAHLKDGNLPSIELVNTALNNNVSNVEVLRDPEASVHSAGGDTLLSKFEEQAERTPQSICMTHREREVTFKEMDLNAERLCLLIQAFTKPSEKFVGLLLPPSIDFILGSIGVFKAGKATVPLSTDYALRQLELMLSDCDEPLLITTHAVINRTGLKYTRALFIDDIIWDGVLVPEGHKSRKPLGPRDLSHCIFTSGTTGKPKAVLLEHGAVLNFIDWLVDYMQITEKDSTIFVTNPAFDGSFIELWPFLFTGAVIHVIPNESYRYDAEERAYFIKEKLITIYNAATPLVEKVLEQEQIVDDCEALRWIICGGDKFRKFPLSKERRFGIILCYGTTEAACTSTALQLQSYHEGIMSVGTAISNVQVYVLNDDLRLVQPGVLGDVYIGGKGIARGYLKEPQLTREKFINDPLSPLPGAKLYRTGDLGYLLPDTSLILQGRADDMVKVRGLRISLGEIEQALLAYPTFKRVVVLLQERHEEQILVAYCTSDSLDSKWPSVEEMRKFLKPTLPPYAMPSVFVPIPEFPVNRNGKIDNAALILIYKNNFPEVSQHRELTTYDLTDDVLEQGRTYKPGDSVEELIMKLWAVACKISPEDITVSSNFFELGGSSLLMAKVIGELQKELGTEIPFNYMIEYSTVDSLAYQITKLL